MGLELFIINLAAALCILFLIGLLVRTGLPTVLSKRFLYCLSALLSWLALNYLSNQTGLPHDVLFAINRLLFVASLLAIVTMLLFCLSIRSEKIGRLASAYLWILGIVGSLLALSPYVVESIVAQGSVVAVTFGWGGSIYFGILGILALSVVGTLLYDTVKARGIAKSRARALSITFGIGLVLIGVTNVILPAFFDSFYLSAIGSLFVVVMLAGVGYSIVKYKLFDIRSFVARSLAYVFAISVLSIVYVIVTFGILSRIAGQSVSVGHEVPYIITALFLGFTFQPMKRFFDKVSDRIFYKDRYDVQDVLNQFSELILGEVRLDKILDGSLSLIDASLKSEFGKIIILDDKNNVVKTSSSGEKHSLDLDRLIGALENSGQDILIIDGEDSVEHKKNRNLYDALKIMQVNNTQLAVRLKTSSRNSIGYIVMGHKRSNGIYTDQDLRLLGLISGELAVAIENSLRFEEIKNFNATLQDRVDTATQRLRRANTQLQRLDEAKDEFVSMASHQLRTPLTSVKGYISMVLEGDAGKLTKMQRQLLGEAFTSSERMVHLIGDFLNVSRLQTGKFILEHKPVDLAKVVEQEVESLQTTAHAHNLKLQYRAPSYFPVLYLDEGKIRQVLMNFMDNAIYYSREGTAITVKLAVEEGDVVLRVEDTGIGVPKSEQAHLFSKFFRATNARKQRPDGTGVGLFLAKKVITAHGGSMVFESIEGEGSTFGFRLPTKKLSTPPADNADKLDK